MQPKSLFWSGLLVTMAVLGNEAWAADPPDHEKPTTQQKPSTGKVTPAKTTLSPEEIAAASKLAQSISMSEWIGPLAPVALSPFFGITCLSAMAIWGEDWLPGGHGLLKGQTALKNPALFWTFLGLTILTALPRLTKVSKPFAQAVDTLEAYAGIVTLIVIRVMVTSASDEQSAMIPNMVVHQAGIVSVSVDTLLAVAIALNVLVINAVKFFFELLVWLVPIPFVDACFEVVNKLVCAALMGLYAFSPTLATLLNLVILAICLRVYFWVRRRTVMYRTFIFDPIISRFWPKYGEPSSAPLIVFAKRAFGPFAAAARLEFQSTSEGWKLTERSWYAPPKEMLFPEQLYHPRIRLGLMGNDLTLDDQGTIACTFSHRYVTRLPQLATQLKATLEEVPDNLKAMAEGLYARFGSNHVTS